MLSSFGAPATTQPTTLPAGRSAVGQAALSPWVVAFIVSFLVPIHLYFGDIRLSVYRIVLLLAFIPALMQILAAEDRVRLRAPDVFFILFAVTGALSLVVTRATISAVGIFVIEALGPYLLARAYVRTPAQFGAVARLFSACIIATLPFAIFESLTGNPILLTALGKVFEVLPNVPHQIRLGLDRAQVTLDHPILYGVFCAMGFTLTLYLSRLDPSRGLALVRGGLVGAATFFSLSSGAFVAVGIQGALVLYDRVFKEIRWRWLAFAIAFVIGYAIIEGLSNRTVPQIAVEYIALDPGTAWTRFLINKWAWSGIMAEPWFGFGFTGHWPRPDWLVTTSIDNFWYALAFRHGLPTVVFLLLAILSLVFLVVRVRSEDPIYNACRISLVITIAAICVAIWTVHLWNATYCAFIFLLGCGSWMLERGSSAQTGEAAKAVAPSPDLSERREAWPLARTALGSEEANLNSPSPLPFSRFDGPGRSRSDRCPENSRPLRR